jgi:hypothetical protein
MAHCTLVVFEEMPMPHVLRRPPYRRPFRHPFRRACLSLALVLPALHGCATTASTTVCRAGESAAAHDLLYFGTSRASGTVTAAEWAAFLEDTVTPRFSQGLTTWDATGQWRRDDGRIVHEATHVLSIVHPDDAATDRAMGELVAAYRARFQQDAVLRVRSAACLSVRA